MGLGVGNIFFFLVKFFLDFVDDVLLKLFVNTFVGKDKVMESFMFFLVAN
jgi:hypothetical protein